MELESQAQRRDATIRRRRAPGEPMRLRLPFGDPVSVRDDSPIGPIELDIEATGPDGAFARWLDDEWWAEAITHWAEDEVTVRIAPTPGALAHPILRHQLDMLRRVVPTWKIVAYAYRDDIDAENGVAEVATAPFHEVRFIDGVRPAVSSDRRLRPVNPLPVLFSRIRIVQMERRVATPILVRLPASSEYSGAAMRPGRTPARDSSGAPSPGLPAVANVMRPMH